MVSGDVDVVAGDHGPQRAVSDSSLLPGVGMVNESSVHQFGPNSAEVTPKGLSKATAIGLVCQHFGVAWEDPVGYGDAANDLEMIRHVHTGVAMGNAVDEVKAAAGHVTGTPEDGGLAASFADLGLT